MLEDTIVTEETMPGYQPSGKKPGALSKEAKRELNRITKRSENALRRIGELDKDWDHLAKAIERWATKQKLKVPMAGILLRLVLLPVYLHEVELNQPSETANEYGEFEMRATNLLLRKRALEDELVAIHNELHVWAKKNAVELITETSESEMDLAAGRLSGIFGSAYPLPPKGYVLNSIKCVDIGNNLWKTTCSYCRIKSVIL